MAPSNVSRASHLAMWAKGTGISSHSPRSIRLPTTSRERVARSRLPLLRPGRARRRSRSHPGVPLKGEALAATRGPRGNGKPRPFLISLRKRQGGRGVEEGDDGGGDAGAGAGGGG